MTLKHVIADVATLLVVLSPSLVAQGPEDSRAMFMPMLAASGSHPSALAGEAPPILGAEAVVRHTATRADLSALVLWVAAVDPAMLQIGPSSIFVYPPLGRVPLVTVSQPLAGGTARYRLPLPALRELVGVDLMLQGISASALGGIAATNLLHGNLGLQSQQGGWAFLGQDGKGVRGGRAPARQYYGFADRGGWVPWFLWHNDSLGMVWCCRIKGKTTPNTRLEWDLDTDASNNGSNQSFTSDRNGNFEITVCTSPGDRVYLYNPNANGHPIDEITVHCSLL